MKPLVILLTLIMSLTLLSACAPMVVGGVALGGAVLHERRSAQTVLGDETIELQAIHYYHQNPDISEHSSISVTSYNYEALLTGQAESAAVSRRFAELIARLPKVTKVYNEVEIGPNISLTRKSQDTYLGSRAKLALADIKIPDFDPLRVKVVAENGVIYLMGLVTPEEAEATVEKVRRIPGVVRVVRIFNVISATNTVSPPST
ncbi:BON domain-containing protein [Thiorhodovibrio winogradskyi]|nr:BON domain-containing protein [Thiorhodovibrio winogradskyi]